VNKLHGMPRLVYGNRQVLSQVAETSQNFELAARSRLRQLTPNG
jgi:hypothetical protein